MSTFGLVGGSGGFGGTTGFGLATGFGISLTGLAAIFVGAAGFATAALEAIASAGFLLFESSLRVAFRAGLIAPGLVPVAVLGFAAAVLLFAFAVFSFGSFAPALVRPVFAAAGLDVFVFATRALLRLVSTLPLEADLDLAGEDFEGLAAFEAEALEVVFLAIGFDEGPLVAGFLAGLADDLLFAAFLVAGFTAVFFFDALATAFTNLC